MSDQNPVFIPGPTNIPDALRKACDMQTLDHRSPKFQEIFTPAVEGVKKVLKTTEAEIILFPASGTGGWEAAISNTLSPGDTVLASRHGMFSHRWIDLCQRHHLDVQVIEESWGKGAPVAAIANVSLSTSGSRKLTGTQPTNSLVQRTPPGASGSTVTSEPSDRRSWES